MNMNGVLANLLQDSKSKMKKIILTWGIPSYILLIPFSILAWIVFTNFEELVRMKYYFPFAILVISSISLFLMIFRFISELLKLLNEK